MYLIIFQKFSLYCTRTAVYITSQTVHKCELWTEEKNSCLNQILVFPWYRLVVSLKRNHWLEISEVDTFASSFQVFLIKSDWNLKLKNLNHLIKSQCKTVLRKIFVVFQSKWVGLLQLFLNILVLFFPYVRLFPFYFTWPFSYISAQSVRPKSMSKIKFLVANYFNLYFSFDLY